MRNGVLISILILILAAYGLYRLFSIPPAPSFRATLVEVDTTIIRSIVFSPHNGAPEFSLWRENDRWIASNGALHLKASPPLVDKILQTIRFIQTNKVIATKKDSLGSYIFDKRCKMQIRLYQDQVLLDDFTIGKIYHQAQPDSALYYLRLSGEEELYAVSAAIADIANMQFEDFRNQRILYLAPELEISGLTFQLPDTSFQILQTPEGWTDAHTLLDSAVIANYLSNLRSISGETFADNFDEVQGSKYLYHTLTIQCKDLDEPFIITCYRDTAQNPPFILHSSQNKEAFFASDSTGIYKRIFVPMHEFYKKEKRAVTSSR